MHTVRRTVRIAAATLTVLATLTACSTPFVSSGVLIPAISTRTPSTTPTPEPIAGDTDENGSLSEHEKQVLAKNAVRDYTMPDGRLVQVNPVEALPAEIVAVIKELATPLNDRIVDSWEGSQGAAQELRELIDQQAAATGRNIVIFHHVWSADPNWGPDQRWWYGDFSGDPIPVKAGRNRDEVLADVTAAAVARNAELILMD